MPTGLWASLLALAVVLLVDVWVYTDAKARAERGGPVVFSVGSFAVESPAQWFLACLILWILFFPLYMTLTGRNPFSN